MCIMIIAVFGSCIEKKTNDTHSLLGFGVDMSCVLAGDKTS